MLRVKGTTIISDKGPVILKGVNLGGWLMPEGYIMCAPNKGYHLFKSAFQKIHGDKTFDQFEESFRDNFIREHDVALIKAAGFNCFRLPFHYALIEQKPYQYSQKGLAYLDNAISWAKKNSLYVILDMHAVPGAQNCDWHSDSDGRALFWEKKEYQKRALVLWEFLADRYKDEAVIAGYDILNETVLDDPKPMNGYYQEAIKSIRAVDKAHIIFIEGNRWAQDIECLDDPADDNVALSFHFYEPLEFTFNFVPGLTYPLCRGNRPEWDKAFMVKRLKAIKKIADHRQRPLLCGEFGVHGRDGRMNEDQWLKDVLCAFNDMDIHWTYWTWKAIKNHMFPDGIYSYYPNDPWVNRPGPQCGWDTWSKYWPERAQEMSGTWRTEKFTVDQNIIKVLQDAC